MTRLMITKLSLLYNLDKQDKLGTRVTEDTTQLLLPCCKFSDARAWNALPSSVRSAPSLLQFRRDLKMALHVSVIVLFTIVFGCVTDCNCNL